MRNPLGSAFASHCISVIASVMARRGRAFLGGGGLAALLLVGFLVLEFRSVVTVTPPSNFDGSNPERTEPFAVQNAGYQPIFDVGFGCSALRPGQDASTHRGTATMFVTPIAPSLQPGEKVSAICVPSIFSQPEHQNSVTALVLVSFRTKLLPIQRTQAWYFLLSRGPDGKFYWRPRE